MTTEAQPADTDQGKSQVTIDAIEGGIHGSTIAGRDVNFIIQMVQQTGGQMPSARNLPALAAALKQALPHLDALNKATTQATIEQLEQAVVALPAHEQAYRERVKTRYANLSSYFVELTGETTVQPDKDETTDLLDLAGWFPKM